MDINQIQPQDQVKDETYLKIWQTEQDHVRTRWTVVTFFISISFAILGFSFQSKFTPEASLAIRISGLFIYWFAFVVLLHFYSFTKFLREYLLEMERTGRTALDIQSKSEKSQLGSSRRFSIVRLFIIFGIIYTIGIAVLWFLGL